MNIETSLLKSIGHLFITSSMVILLFTACGQKGPLFLPEETSDPNQTEEQEIRQQTDKQEIQQQNDKQLEEIELDQPPLSY